MRILEVVTEHTGPIKVLFEVLKDMLTETNIDFIVENVNKKNVDSKNGKKKNKKKDAEDDEEEEEEEEDDAEEEEQEEEDEEVADNDDDEQVESDKEDDNKENKKKNKDGMKIIAVDTTKTVLINLKLDAKKFTKFVCKKKKLSLGVNLNYFYKLIKAMGKNDILTLYLDHDDKNNLNIKIDSPEVNKNKLIKLKLLDLNESKISIPETTFEAVVTMDSQEFHRLCREMNQIADYVEIKCLKDKIVFTCKGDYANIVNTYSSNENNIGEDMLVRIKHASSSNDSNAPQIVQGVFELKNLVLFSKCASLCNDIEIYMKNDYPLVIKYTVSTLGRILLCLTPVNEDPTKNNNYSDEDEMYSDEELNIKN